MRFILVPVEIISIDGNPLVFKTAEVTHDKVDWHNENSKYASSMNLFACYCTLNDVGL
jgi:hypothetical protein